MLGELKKGGGSRGVMLPGKLGIKLGGPDLFLPVSVGFAFSWPGVDG